MLLGGFGSGRDRSLLSCGGAPTEGAMLGDVLELKERLRCVILD